jgi:hypothetical protein
VSEICLVDVELEDVVVIVNDVIGSLAHRFTRARGFTGAASQDELIVALTRKAVEDAARVAAQVAPLWGPFADGDEDTPFGQQRNDRVHSRASIRPNRRQVHQDVLLPQRPSRSGQVGGLSRELPPRRHGRKVPATCFSTNAPIPSCASASCAFSVITSVVSAYAPLSSRATCS